MNFISPQRAANNQIHSKIQEKRNRYIQEKKLRQKTKVSSLRGRQPLDCLALRPPIGPNALEN